MKHQNIAGCCALTNIYNLGSSHAVRRLSFDQFSVNLLAEMKKSGRHVMCITNHYQTAEMGYLVRLGFKKTPIYDGAYFWFGDYYKVKEKLLPEKQKKAEPQFGVPTW